MPLNLFYTMVQKSQKWPKTQIRGGGSCLNRHKPWKQLVPILHKLQVDRDKVESLQVVGAKFRYWLCKVVQSCWR